MPKERRRPSGAAVSTAPIGPALDLADALGRPRVTPVVATNVGGLPAAVDHGRTGLLTPPGDPAALAEAIEQLAADPHRFDVAIAGDREAASFARYADLLAGAIEEAA